MRTVLILFMLSYFAACTGGAFACPIEGPNMPNSNSWKTGIQANAMFDKEMKNINGELDSKQLFLTLSYGFAEWLCFDGKLGVGDVTFEITDSEKIDYPAGFAGGYGGRILLHEDRKNGINCILGLHHISVHPGDTNINGIKHDGILDEWQASILVSKKVHNLRPYLAGKFSKIYLIRRVNDERERVTPEDDWGFVFGVDLDINENARFNLEGRLFDENSLTIGFNYTF